MERMFLDVMIIISLFVFWCINEKIGFQICIVALITSWVIALYLHLEFNLSYDFRWVITALIFCGYLLLRKPLEKLFAKGGFRAYMIGAALVSFLMIVYRPRLDMIFYAGSVLGLGVGYCLNKRFIGFKSSEMPERKGIKMILFLFARFLIGMAGLAIIGFRVGVFVFKVYENQNINLYCFVCSALICFWVSIAAPWLFIKLRLAGTEKIEDE